MNSCSVIIRWWQHQFNSRTFNANLLRRKTSLTKPRKEPCLQEQLYNLRTTAHSVNVGLFVKKLWRISIWPEQSIKSSVGRSKCVPRTAAQVVHPTKLALLALRKLQFSGCSLIYIQPGDETDADGNHNSSDGYQPMRHPAIRSILPPICIKMVRGS